MEILSTDELNEQELMELTPEEMKERLDRQGLCRYNSGVECDTQSKCANCGWRPEVAERRKAELRKKDYKSYVEYVLFRDGGVSGKM